MNPAKTRYRTGTGVLPAAAPGASPAPEIVPGLDAWSAPVDAGCAAPLPAADSVAPVPAENGTPPAGDGTEPPGVEEIPPIEADETPGAETGLRNAGDSELSPLLSSVSSLLTSRADW